MCFDQANTASVTALPTALPASLATTALPPRRHNVVPASTAVPVPLPVPAVPPDRTVPDRRIPQ